MSRWLPAVLVLASITLVTPACANPSPDFGDYLLSVRWIVRTIPINYFADMAALALAVWVTGNAACFAWRFLPIYSLPVLLAGYVADFGARSAWRGGWYDFDLLIGYPTDRMSGSLGHDYATLMSGGGQVSFILLASFLIFILNAGILYAVLRWNDCPCYSRLPLAAGVMAVCTAPYMALNRGSVAPFLMPAAALALCGATVALARMGFTSLWRRDTIRGGRGAR